MTIFKKTFNLKQFISLVLALGVMMTAMCAVSFSASAEEDGETLTHGYFEYTVEEGDVCITAYTGDGGDVSIPNMINDMSVVAIGDEAFWYQDNLTAIDLPDYLEYIGARAFQGCSLLDSVTIPDSVMEIGDAAFCDCSSLASVNIPSGLTYVGGGAFDNTLWIKRFEDNTSIIFGGRVFYKYLGDAEVVNIPEGVIGISGNAFTGKKTLTYVNIPDSVVFIGDYAFFGCPELKSLSIPDGVYYMGVYSMGYNALNENGEEKNEEFVLYANPDTLGAEYADKYEIQLKSPSEHATPDELPDAETCVARDLKNDGGSKGAGKLNTNGVVAIVLIIVSCTLIIGGLSLFFSIREKKLKKEAKAEKKAHKSKKKK